MSELFEPNYAVLTFLFIKKFGLYYALVALLALIRFVAGPWVSRFFALIAFAASLAALGFTYAPTIPVTEILDHPDYPRLVEISNLLNGMVIPLAIAVLFLLTTVFRRGRATWIDFIFLVLTFMLLILWGATTYLV